MTSMLKKLGMCSVIAIAVAGATPAFAAQTASNTSITNTATVSYQVNNQAQPAIQASNSFTVDRKVAVTLTENGTTTTSVQPGQTNQITAFTLTNNSNATLDFDLSSIQTVGGAAAHGGTDNFDVTNVRYYLDSNNNGVIDGTDAQITYLDNIAQDAIVGILVVADIPTQQTNGSVANIRLTATALEPGTVGTKGDALTGVTTSANANTTGMDTVLSDVAAPWGGAGDIANDGKASDDDDYTVASAVIAVAKTSRILSDPINNTTNPKAIPGAVIEYCIAVTNTGTVDATSVNINDPVPGGMTGTGTTGRIVTGSATATCNFALAGTGGGTVSATNASAALGTVPGATTSWFVFQATINPN